MTTQEPVDYDLLLAQARELFSGERDAIANCANASALVFTSLPDLNWAGFYFVRGETLVLGPFAGKPATTRIARGKGVCGAAWESAQTQVVPDVHAFAGHIACDPASNSEIVVPISFQGRIVGVLDIDSPVLDRFSARERTFGESLAALISAACDWNAGSFSAAP